MLKKMRFALQAKVKGLEWKNIAFGSNRDGLIAMRDSFLDCPDYDQTRVLDLEDNTVVQG